MQLIITLSRPVETIEQAQQLTTIVRNKLIDHPEIQIQSQVTDNLSLED